MSSDSAVSEILTKQPRHCEISLANIISVSIVSAVVGESRWEPLDLTPESRQNRETVRIVRAHHPGRIYQLTITNNYLRTGGRGQSTADVVVLW